MASRMTSVRYDGLATALTHAEVAASCRARCAELRGRHPVCAGAGL
jgi:hypothetical protein